MLNFLSSVFESIVSYSQSFDSVVLQAVIQFIFSASAGMLLVVFLVVVLALTCLVLLISSKLNKMIVANTESIQAEIALMDSKS